MPKTRLLPKRQDWLIIRMKRLGYHSNVDGVCYGIAHMGMQAILSERIAEFNDRLIKLKIEILQDTVDLRAFFDGVQLYQLLQRLKNIVGSDRDPKQKDVECCATLQDISPLISDILKNALLHLSITTESGVFQHHIGNKM